MDEDQPLGEYDEGIQFEDSAAEKPRDRPSPSETSGPIPDPTDPRTGQRRVPVRARELVGLVLLVILSDMTIYHGYGFAGFALLFLAAPVLLLLASPRPHWGWTLWLIGILIGALAARMWWCGSVLLVTTGFVLLAAFATRLSGVHPHVLKVMVFASQTILAGYEGLALYWRSLGGAGLPLKRTSWLNIALPSAALFIFGMLFILANPDLLASFGEAVEQFFQALRDWILECAPKPSQIFFWIAAIWISIGLLRPVLTRALLDDGSHAEIVTASPVEDQAGAAHLYPAYRNTLITVVCLFAIYLVFEFKTLWFRVFPVGFYYAGYAHEGAAWLTLALALATVVLSLIFRGRVLSDARLPALRRLAWIWSFENALLAIAVYNRLYIYIGFNGMTRMRIIGIFGMSAVVVGFFLVLWKIARNKGFIWLVRRHLLTLALTIYLFAMTPVDAIWVRYNVKRVLAGDLAPSVQISVHPIGSEGMLLTRPLLECRDPIIREGVRAMWAEWHAESVRTGAIRHDQGWTTIQLSDELVHKGLQRSSADWATYDDIVEREIAIDRFREYAYQWY